MTSLESRPPLNNGLLEIGKSSAPVTDAESSVQSTILLLDRLARTRLRVLDATSEGIYQINSEGLCTFMNRAACAMLGYGFGEALGRQMHDLHHVNPDGSELAAADCPIHGRFEEMGRSEPTEVVFRRTNGASFPVESCSHPIIDKEIREGTVVTFRDITERRRAERCLKVQLAVSRTLESTASIEEIIPLLLRSLGESLDFSWGALWQVDQSADVLCLANTWCILPSELEKLEESCRGASFSQGQELIGKAWASGQPIWISDLHGSGAAHTAVAAGAGFRSAFALPIRMTETVFGVFEFLSSEPVTSDPDLLSVLSTIASAIGQVIERKRTESVRDRLSAILDAATDFVGLVVNPEGIILSVSRAVESIFGFAPSEVIGKPLSVLIPEYRRHLRENDWPDDLAAASFPSCCVRMRGLLRSGGLVPLEVSLDEYAESGSRVIAGIIRDITDRTISEETLERQAENLRRSEETVLNQTRLVTSIVTSMADGVLAADENGELVIFNPAAASLLGAQRLASSNDYQALADIGYEFLLPDQRTPYPPDQLPLRRAIRGETVDATEVFVKTPQRADGFWLNVTARPMIDNDGVSRGGVLVIRDVTEQKTSREALRQAKDEAESANRAKSEFLSRMSHELRTPMNAILGFAQLLSEEALPAEQADAIARILKAGRHLLGLINEVLDISRIEAGHLNMQMERIRPFEAMQAAIELIGPLAAQRQIDVVSLSGDAAQWCIQADRQRLIQVFVNLLGNAIKYNRERGRVTVLFDEAPGKLLRMKVADTGFGIAPHQLKKLFVPFERLGAERSGVEGTGLGLAYSNRLVTEMGGTIGIESEVGKGSVFWVEIPFVAAEAPAEEMRPQSEAPSGNISVDMGLAKVLCIQNDPDSFRSIEEVFERLPGYQLVSAERGSIGLQRVRDEAMELVLLDLQLPDMDGIEALHELRAQLKPRQTPIVVVTADWTAEIERRALDAGAHSCLPKPIQVRNFLDTIVCLI